MKIEINTKNKTIVIQDEVVFSEFIEFINSKFSSEELKEYKIISNYIYTYTPSYPTYPTYDISRLNY